MKKILLSLTAIACVLNADYLKDDEVKKFNDIDFIKGFDGQVKNVYDADSFYIADIKVHGKSDKVFITKDKKALIKGYAVDMSNGEQIDSPIKDVGIAKDKEAFALGTGPDEFMIFTDPQCPYYKELEKYFPQLLEKTKIKIYYYPLLQIHPEAGELSKFQMQLAKTENDKIKVLNMTTDDEDYKKRSFDEKTLKELEEKLKEQMLIGDEFGIQGTPTIISADGKKLTWVEFLTKYNINVYFK